MTMSATSSTVSANVLMAAENTSGMLSHESENAAPREPVEDASTLPYIISECMSEKPTPPATVQIHIRR